MAGRKSVSTKGIKIFFSILGAVVFVFLMWELFFFLKCYSIVSKIPQDNNQVLRIMLFGSSDNPDGETVSAKISVLDRNGGEVAVIERSWPEPYLSVDFRSAQFLNRQYFFPYIIYGSSTVASYKSFFRRNYGSNLSRYYIENGQCLMGIDQFQKKGLFYIFYFALNKNTVSLSSCKTGIYYGVFVEDGRLTVHEE